MFNMYGDILSKDCIHRGKIDCPMYYQHSEWHDTYEEWIHDDIDNTTDDGFCDRGVAK